jgi:hypothetical protein
MPKSAPDTPAEPRASRTLLSAALGGLLAVAPACGARVPLDKPPPDSGSDAPVVVADSGAESGPDASPTVDAAADAPTDASIACADAGSPDAAVVTSTTYVPSLTLADFTTECDQRGGTVEIEPHCGGSNSCRGMSYDTGTGELTEHTCKGMNTCAGYSCIICD